MTDSTPTQATPTPPQTSTEPPSVIIRPWPKVVFLYPVFLCATVFWILSWLSGATENGYPVRFSWMGNTFLMVVFLNFLVFAFDFSRIKSITMVISGILVIVLVLWLDTKWDLTGYLGGLFGAIHIKCNAPFYGFLSGGLGLLLLIVFINSRFHYYEVNAREILHHHGYLGDVRRWSTEGLEMNKEIYDVAEYVLLRSGRLIFSPMTSKKAIVLPGPSSKK